MKRLLPEVSQVDLLEERKFLLVLLEVKNDLLEKQLLLEERKEVVVNLKR